MSTTKFVFNPFTSNFDEIVNTIDLASDVTGILPVANGGTGLSAQPQTGVTFYVDKTRTDTYTADGSPERAFKTIGAALSQIITNNNGNAYIIIVAAGDYAESITLNDAAFTRIAIVAASVANGQLSGDPIPVTTVLDITSNANNDQLKAILISGFVFRNLTMVGASNGSNFCQYGSMISNCTQLSTATISIDVENAGQVVFADCGFSQSSGAGNVTVQNVNSFLVYKSLFSVGAMSIITNNGANKPTGFAGTTTQFSFGSLAGAITVDAGSAIRTRWNRVLASISNSGLMASIMANFIGAVTINSGGTWSSTGDIVNSTPTNAGTITNVGVLQASGANLSSLSVSSPVLTDANKNLVSGNINLASQVTSVLPEANGGTHQSTYTTGDLLYASASNTLSKRAIGSTGDVLTVTGGIPTWAAPTSSPVAPTVQSFLSGSGTYTRPTSPTPLYIKVTMVGGGGGASGSGTATSGVEGGNGGNTTFGSSLLTANGGTGGTYSSTTNAAGGSASLGAAVGLALTGGSGGLYMTGGTATVQAMGAAGGQSALGGAAGGGRNGGTGDSGATNTGGGGGAAGVGTNSAALSGNSGAAGGYVQAIITSPASTYSYAVGAAGTAGTAGTGGSAGGAGGSGIILVEEFYQ